jgi:hypothetical protein
MSWYLNRVLSCWSKVKAGSYNDRWGTFANKRVSMSATPWQVADRDTLENAGSNILPKASRCSCLRSAQHICQFQGFCHLRSVHPVSYPEPRKPIS